MYNLIIFALMIIYIKILFIFTYIKICDFLIIIYHILIKQIILIYFTIYPYNYIVDFDS